MFITEAFAAAAPVSNAAPSSDLARFMFQFGLILLVFYIFLIRPQSKKMKEHQKTLASLKKGDKVITQGGIMGKVVKIIDDHEVLVEIAENIRVIVIRDKIAAVMEFEKKDKENFSRASSANENKEVKQKSHAKSRSKELKEILS